MGLELQGTAWSGGWLVFKVLEWMGHPGTEASGREEASAHPEEPRLCGVGAGKETEKMRNPGLAAHRSSQRAQGAGRP